MELEFTYSVHVSDIDSYKFVVLNRELCKIYSARAANFENIFTCLQLQGLYDPVVPISA